MQAKKKLLYLHMEIGNISPGVAKKVQDQIHGLKNRYSCEYIKVEKKSVFALILIVYKKVLGSNCAVLYIRNKLFFNLFFLPLLIVKKRRNTVLVLEIPTPLDTLELEIKQSAHSFFKRFVSLWMLRVAMPLTLPVFNLVATVIEERSSYRKYIRNEIVVGNGIDTGRIVPVSGVQKQDGQFRLLAIGHISRWHGYDRLIEGLKEYIGNGGMDKIPVVLDIVGDGPESESLEKTAEKKGLRDKVHFPGEMRGNDLIELYMRSDACVGTLGAHRKGLSQTASLKHREFCAFGLPFITSAEDPDFPSDDVDFVFYQEPDESPVDVAELVGKLGALRRNDPNLRERIRTYAEDRLDWSVKFKPLLAEIERVAREKENEE